MNLNNYKTYLMIKSAAKGLEAALRSSKLFNPVRLQYETGLNFKDNVGDAWAQFIKNLPANAVDPALKGNQRGLTLAKLFMRNYSGPTYGFSRKDQLRRMWRAMQREARIYNENDPLARRRPGGLEWWNGYLKTNRRSASEFPLELDTTLGYRY